MSLLLFLVLVSFFVGVVPCVLLRAHTRGPTEPTSNQLMCSCSRVVQVECLSPGTTRGAVDFQDFSKFYEFCTGLSLQADQRRNIWLRLGKPSSGCELSDGDTGARLQVIVPGGDGTATSVNPVDRPSNDEVLRFGLGGELELEEWLACGATLFPCLGQARFLELIEEFRNSLAVAAQHDFPRIEVRRELQLLLLLLGAWGCGGDGLTVMSMRTG